MNTRKKIQPTFESKGYLIQFCHTRKLNETQLHKEAFRSLSDNKRNVIKCDLT